MFGRVTSCSGRHQVAFKKRAPRALRVVRQFASKVMMTTDATWQKSRFWDVRSDPWGLLIFKTKWVVLPIGVKQ